METWWIDFSFTTLGLGTVGSPYDQKKSDLFEPRLISQVFRSNLNVLLIRSEPIESWHRAPHFQSKRSAIPGLTFGHFLILTTDPFLFEDYRACSTKIYVDFMKVLFG